MKPHFLFFLCVFIFGAARLHAAPVIISQPATDVTDLTATINGTINVNSVGSWLVEFNFADSPEGLYATVFPDTNTFVYGSSAGNNTINIKSSLSIDNNRILKPSTTYYFRLRARSVSDLDDVHLGDVHTFTTNTASTPPAVTTLPHFNPPSISHNEAELRAEVFSGSSHAKVFLQYSQTANDFSSQVEAADLINPNSEAEKRVQIQNLAPTTRYHYRWMATNSEGSVYSQALTLDTTAAPTVSVFPATNIVADSAVLNGKVRLNGGLNAAVYFEYGETAAYGKSVQVSAPYDASGNAEISHLVTQLKANTTYHYRLVAKQNQNRAVVHTGGMTFTTEIDGEKPVLLADPAIAQINVSHVSIIAPSLFTGTSQTTLSVEYGTTQSLGQTATKEESLDGFTTYSDSEVNLSNLLPNTTYYYSLSAANSTGVTTSEIVSFTTSKVPEAVNSGTLYIGDLSSKVLGTFTNYGGYCLPGVEWGTSTAYGEISELIAMTRVAGTTTREASLRIEPSTLYHYRFFVFDGTNFHYSENKTFTSAARYTLPEISDAKVQNITFGLQNPYRKYVSADSARITANVFSGAFSASFEIEYGETNSLGQTASYSTQLAVNKRDFLNITLTNLDPNTTYYWRAKSTNASGSVYSSIESVTTLQGPIINTQPTITVTDSTVTFAGDITPDPWSYNLEFIYGSDVSLSNTSEEITPTHVNGIYDGVIDVSTRNATSQVTGLLPSTTYYYQLRARAGHFFPNRIYTGEVKSFTTLAPSTKPRITQGIQLLSKTDTTASLRLGGFASETSDATVSFEYGLTQSYGSEATHPDTFLAYTTGSPDIELPNLSPNTTYHVRAKVLNAAGASYSTNYRFTTLPIGDEPTFTGSPNAQLIAISSAQLHVGSINSGGADTSITFEYGATTAYGSSVSQTISANTISSPFANITSLVPNTEYHYRITAQNAYGAVTTSDSTFSTVAGAEAETLVASAITDISATLNAEFTPNSILGFRYFDWGETSSYGDSVFIAPSSNNEPIESVSHVISGLQPNTTYHFRARFSPRFGFGVVEYGDDLTFTTSDPSTVPSITGKPYTTELTSTGTKVQLEKVTSGGAAATITFEYGTDSNYGQSISYITPVEASSSVDKPTVELVNLQPDTVYHVRARVTSSLGIVISEEFIFSTSFNLTAEPVINVSHHEVTLRGSINPGGQELDVSFQWGTAPTSTGIALISPGKVNGFVDTLVSTERVGLAPSTTYYYRLKATDSVGFVYYGPQQSFTTGAALVTPTVMGDIYMSSASSYDSASFRTGSIDSGDATTQLTVEYGTDNNFDNSFVFETITPNRRISSFFNLTNLPADTEYQVRIKAENSHGVDYSNVLVFRTRQLPTLTALSATGIADESATMRASLNLNGNRLFSVSIVYGTGDNFNGTIRNLDYTFSPDTGTYVYSTANIRLTPSTTYSYKLKMGDLESGVQMFTTLPPSTPPVILGQVSILKASDLSDTKVRLDSGQMTSGSSNAQVVLQYGTSQIYGTEKSIGTLYHNSSSRSFSSGLADLSPNTVYHVRVKATNSEGVSFSPNFTFRTHSTPTLVLDSVTDVNDLTALFSGTVNPMGRQLDARFVYKAENQSGTNSPVIQIAGDSSSTILYNALNKLKPDTNYSCYLSISDGLNFYSSDTLNFKTELAGSPPTLTGELLVTNISNEKANFRLFNSFGDVLLPGSSDATVTYEYGTTESFGQTIGYFSPYRVGARVSFFPSNLLASGMTAGTTYFVRVKASNAEGSVYSDTVQFTTLPSMLVQTGEASDIGEFSASVTGSIEKQLTEGVSSPFVSSSIEWGATGDLGFSKTFYTPTSLTALIPGTTYYYRLRSKYSNDANYTYGEIKSFTTSPPTSLPSFGARPVASNIRANSVRITTNWYTGGAAADLMLEYGTSSNLGSSIEVVSNTQPKGSINTTYHTISDLEPGTTYYLRAKATSELGTVTGEVITFTTTDLAQAYDIVAANITTNAASLTGKIQTGAASQTVRFEWGLDSSYGSSTNGYYNGVLYRSNIYGLLPSKTYHFRMVIIGDGLTQYSEDVTFTTSPSPNPPILSDNVSVFNITASAATLWIESVSAPADITFDYGMSESFGSQFLFPTSTSSTNEIHNATADLIDLQPDTTYYYRISATNTQGQTVSETRRFRTLKAPVIVAKDADDILGDSVTLMGGVKPYNNLLDTRFEYGLTEFFGMEIVSTSTVGAGDAVQDISSPLSNLQPDTVYYYRVIVRDARGEEYTGPSRTVTTLDLLGLWRVVHYGTADNTGTAADLAISSHDGVPNLIKYALGVSPSSKLPLAILLDEYDGEERLGLSFERDPLKKKIVYHVEASSSLIEPWEVIATSAVGESTSGIGYIVESAAEDGKISVDVRDTQAMSSTPKRFIRLRIDKAE